MYHNEYSCEISKVYLSLFKLLARVKFLTDLQKKQNYRKKGLTELLIAVNINLSSILKKIELIFQKFLQKYDKNNSFILAH